MRLLHGLNDPGDVARGGVAKFEFARFCEVAFPLPAGARGRAGADFIPEGALASPGPLGRRAVPLLRPLIRAKRLIANALLFPVSRAS
jgi:hypothetical protein